MADRSIDFFFFIGSTYSYLSVQRVDRLAAERGVNVRWRPFDLRAIFSEMKYTPYIGKPAKIDYMWRDISRRARKLDVAFTGAAPYPVDKNLKANKIAAVLTREEGCRKFVRNVYEMWFLEKQDPSDPRVIRDALQRAGLDAEAVLAMTEADSGAALNEATDRARELRVFGAPSFVSSDGELFWGDDRLEDAIEWAAH